MLLRTRFSLLVLFLFFVLCVDLVRLFIYNDIKEKVFHRNIALTGRVISDKANLMSLGILRVDKKYKAKNREKFSLLWERYLQGDSRVELTNTARLLGYENPQVMFIDLMRFSKDRSSFQHDFPMHPMLLDKIITASKTRGEFTYQTLPIYMEKEGALIGFVYRYDELKDALVLLKMEYNKRDEEVQNILELARKISENLKEDDEFHVLSFYVCHKSSGAGEYIAHFEANHHGQNRPHEELDRNLFGKALSWIPQDEMISVYSSDDGHEVYLQREWLVSGEMEANLCLAFSIYRQKYQIQNDFIYLITLLFWVGIVIFVITFIELFKRRLLAPIHKIIQEMNSKKPIPLEVAKESREFVALIKVYNQLLDELRNENIFSRSLLEYQDRFIKDSIHDINTPLAVILLNVGLLELEIGENEYLMHIKSGIHTLQNTYSDLSYLLEREREGFSCIEELDLVKILQERIDFFRIVAHANGKKINFHTDESMIKVKMNSNKLKRLIDNNLSNAIKYAFIDSLIDISVRRFTTKAFVSFSNYSEKIKDTQTIFMRYARGNVLHAGYGIGLATVKEICEEYNIGIEVTSDLVTTFTYTFLISD